MHFVKLTSYASWAFLSSIFRSPPVISFVLQYHRFGGTFALSLPLLLILLCSLSLCVFRLVSSARPSYIPGMPATYGPHSSRSAERPTAPHRWPGRDQPTAKCATAFLQPKIILTQLYFSSAYAWMSLGLIKPHQSKLKHWGPNQWHFI